MSVDSQDVPTLGTARANLRSRDSGASGSPAAGGVCAVIPISRAWSYNHAERLTTVLKERLAGWEAEEEAGPHVVIARGLDSRCFGPFPDRTRATAAACAEAEEWKREFPDLEVTFEAVPLRSYQDIAPDI